MRYKGNPIKHHEGVPYLVDCNVTGSDRGTPTSPKFALKDLWEYTLIPSIEDMVKVGGPCEGATVILQEDNAGPHCDETYKSFLSDAFTSRGWRVELQAPQGGVLFVVIISVHTCMVNRSLPFPEQGLTLTCWTFPFSPC